MTHDNAMEKEEEAAFVALMGGLHYEGGLQWQLDRKQVRAILKNNAELVAQVAELKQRNIELGMLGYKWMEAHDLCKAGKAYTTPRPTDVPDAIARAEAAEARVKVLEGQIQAERDRAARDSQNQGAAWMNQNGHANW